MAITRRRMLGAGAGFVGLGLSAKAHASVPYSNRSKLVRQSECFAYGVASGDPLADRIILWTHVGGGQGEAIPVRWELALDLAFEEIVSEGTAWAEASRDYTIKVDAEVPFPAHTYYYRFHVENGTSPIGRTKSAPRDSNNIRLAVVSCSSIWSGYFTAYEKLAKRHDIDLIVHCGDYVYDVPDEDERRNMPFNDLDAKMPASLDDHRRRLRYYRSNDALREAHRQHPWSVVWDNHDIESPAPKGAGEQAFLEWLPIREHRAGRVYRSLDFGSLAKIILLDTRSIGRDQLLPTGKKGLLGTEQKDWIADELASQTGQWTIFVNQVLLTPFKAFGFTVMGHGWDGYTQDRDWLAEELLDYRRDTLILTGDAHLSIASNFEYYGYPIAAEFLPSSVTRGNLDDVMSRALANMVKGTFEKGMKAFNPHLRYFETEYHGYGLVDIRPEGAKLEFWYVNHIDPLGSEQLGKVMLVNRGENVLREAPLQASQRKGQLPAPAPLEQRLFNRSLQFGGQGGDYFDAMEYLSSDSRLTRVRVRGADRIDALRFEYADGDEFKLGGRGGREESLSLRNGEYIRSLDVCIGTHKGSVRVFYIQLLTSRGEILTCGTKSGSVTRVEAPQGQHIVGFAGRAGDELDRLGAIFAPDF